MDKSASHSSCQEVRTNSEKGGWTFCPASYFDNTGNDSTKAGLSRSLYENDDHFPLEHLKNLV
jgi:hypothetical protein